MDEADRARFDAMLDHHSRALLRTAYLLTGDRHLAEDLLQSALAKTWTRWSTIRDAERADAYVRTVMVNLSISWWRRRWRREVPTQHLPDVIAVDPYAGVEHRDEIGRALATLTLRQRAILVLRFYDDMSEADVAAVLGCSVGTVKSTASRALATLRESMATPASPADELGSQT
jgi:RNA polymerase sigma-70 factor (sigma-E family)